MIDINKVYNENCLETLARMPDDCIDMTLTSPPYDNLRSYQGYCFDFEAIAKELYRVTKQGGVVVWIVADATIKGSETGSSFSQALYFKHVCGFNLHDTMIYAKNGVRFPFPNRYHNCFEYMFILTKGYLKTFNPLMDRPNITVGKSGANMKREMDGTKTYRRPFIASEMGKRYNIWNYSTGGVTDFDDHPAIFPEQLAADHIKSWSNEGDLVYDPMLGSGTTAKMAIMLKRNWIGSEISSEYYEIIQQRLNNLHPILL